MSNNKRILGLLLFIFIFASVIYIGSTDKIHKVQPKADDGVIELADWDFDKDGVAILDGEWEFYWNQLIEPDDFESGKGMLTGYYDIPLYWHKYKDLDLPVFGHATYRLVINVKAQERVLAVRLPDVSSAYKAWVNGELVAQRGSMLSDDNKTPHFRPIISNSFVNESDKIEIVLQISNYIDVHSGVSHSIELASVNQIYEKSNIAILEEAILFGICIIMALYHFILYAYRKRNREVLFFGFVCVAIGIRIISHGENILSHIFTNIPYSIGSAINYGTVPLSALFYSYFTYYLFNKYISKKLLSLFSIVHITFALSVLLTPLTFYGSIYIYFLGILVVNAYYALIHVVIKALLNREQEAIIVILGSLVIFFAIINDILYFRQATDTGYVVSFALFIFIFFQSLVIAKRFSQAFKNVESMSERLITLDKIKDEFLANTSHELRTPVNGIIGISESLIDGATGELLPQTKDNLEMIVSSGKRLASLINDILDFSKEGVGTRFYYTFKISSEDSSAELIKNDINDLKAFVRKRNEQKLVTADFDAGDKEDIFNNGIKILVVDDERINVQVLSNYLAIKKYQVDAASDGIEALEKIQQSQYDLVLLDIIMPKISGYDVCRKIREQYSLYDLPVILLTAKNQVQDVAAGFDVGANDYLVKPFEKNELIARVKTLISLKNAVRAAIAHAKLFGEVKKLAELDGLTGLNNRRHLLELAKKEWDNAAVANKELSVLMIDIDFFKKVNDTYGHEAGDVVLKIVADTIVKAIRGSDFAGRFGGEEFAVVMPDTSLNAAKLVAERIRREIKEQKYFIEGYDDLRCTVSIGAASCAEYSSEIDVLFKNADAALYNAKRNGRDRVEG